MNARSSARWVTISQVVRSGLQLASIAVLARMLDASDYGLMALAGIITNLAYAVRDLGTTSSVIQRPVLDKSFEATVFVVNLVVGVTLTVAVAGASYPAAHFFRSDKLQGVLLALSPIFAIGCLSILQQAKLERLASFRQLALIEMAAAFIGVVVALVAAAAHLGVYSLVLQALASTLFTSVTLTFRSVGRWPSGRPTRQTARELFSMSGSLTSYAMLMYLKGSVDTLIIGRSLGDSILGAYNIAGKVALMPIQNIAWICGRSLLPSMSAVQSDTPRLGVIYIRSVAIVAFVCLPCMAGLWVLRDTFTLAVLGPRWSAAAGILAWLAPVGFLNAIESTTGAVLVARGKPHAQLAIGLFSTCGMTIAMLLGSRFGLTGALSGLLLATFAATVMSLARAAREVSVSLFDLCGALAPIVLAALASSLTAMFAVADQSVAQLHPAARLAIVVPTALVAYIGVTFLIARKPLVDVLSIVGLRRRNVN